MSLEEGIAKFERRLRDVNAMADRIHRKIRFCRQLLRQRDAAKFEAADLERRSRYRAERLKAAAELRKQFAGSETEKFFAVANYCNRNQHYDNSFPMPPDCSEEFVETVLDYLNNESGDKDAGETGFYLENGNIHYSHSDI